MARKTTTTTTTSEKTKTRTARRVTSLEAKAKKQLTSLEEAVVRMHHGVSLKAQAQLASNGGSDELMAQLFEMEVRAFVESGRIEDLPDVPASKKKGNARTQKVVAALKKK